MTPKSDQEIDVKEACKNRDGLQGGLFSEMMVRGRKEGDQDGRGQEAKINIYPLDERQTAVHLSMRERRALSVLYSEYSMNRL